MTVQLRPGQVAAAAGVNLETLRYYERRGLLEPPDRTLGGHRVYPSEAVTLLRIIKTAQRLGFSLTMFAVYIFLLRSIGGYGFVTCIAASAVASFGIDFVFVRWLSVPLPAGLFGF